MEQITIYEIPVADRHILAPLFRSMDDTTITSCLEGRCMGCAWADDPEHPTAAYVQLGGRFDGTCGYGFAAGDADSPAATALVTAWKPEWAGDNIIIPQNDKWSAVISQVFGSHATLATRYATSKKELHLDRAQLEKWAAAVPDGYTVRMNEERDFAFFSTCGWAMDTALDFADVEDYMRNSFAFIAEQDGKQVSIAGCYSSYSGGIEIEIETLPEHRRKGLSRACTSRLLLECIDRGLYPSWDAANTKSLSLAKSLGYVFAGEYAAYETESGYLRKLSGKENA